MSGVEFERFVTALLARMEFRPEMTRATGDGGIDIVAILDKPILGGKYLFQCKRYAPENLVGASTVREFLRSGHRRQGRKRDTHNDI